MKKKRAPSRRGRALKLAAWLVILSLVSGALGVIRLLPEQALRQVWQRTGMTDAQVVHAEWGTTTDRPRRVYLCESGDYILMASANWSLLNGGWFASGDGIILDKNDPEQHYNHWMTSLDGMISGCAVGFVPVGEKVPELWLRFREGDRDALGQQAYYGEPVILQPRTIVPVKGGSCYLVQFRLPEPETEGIYTYPGIELVY